MSLTTRATLAPPVGGMTGEPAAAHPAQPPRADQARPALKPRCRMLRLPSLTRCPDEALDDSGLCPGCMAEIRTHLEAKQGPAPGKGVPGFQSWQPLSGLPSSVPFADLCSRCGRPGHTPRRCTA